MKKIVAVLSAFMFAVVGCAADSEDPSQSSEDQLQAEGSGGETGGACHLSSGPYAGRTGTYGTDDDGKTWCCVDGTDANTCGGSECGANGGRPDPCASQQVKPRVPRITVTGGVSAKF